MPRIPKESQFREDEEERDDVAAPRVDEEDVEDDRAQSKRDDDAEIEVGEDDLVEEIDLDEMNAMEGPDA
jgi:hypothetical protein